MVLKKDTNGMAAGARLVSTPSFKKYRLPPVADGIKDRLDLPWQQAAWASAEDSAPHGIEIRLAKPVRGGRFQITWAFDINDEENGRWWISRDYCIQVSQADAAWRTVARAKDNQSAVGSYPLPEDEPFRYLRVVQFSHGGPRRGPT